LSLSEVSVDRVQIQQVIINLLVNAMHAMETLERRELVVLSREAAPDSVEITVRDSGVGLEAVALSRLFTPFYTTKPQGMGMGLSISRSIVEAHGGRIWAEPNEGPGVTFHVALPAVRKAA
jgi:two-component system sensor kinase FixL